MAPEQAESAPVTERADVFSLGAVLYECLTGSGPFEGLESVEQMKAAHERGIPPLRALRPETPVFLAELVTSSLAAKAAHRPHSAAEVARHLQAVARRVGEPCDDLATADLMGVLEHRRGLRQGGRRSVAGTELGSSFQSAAGAPNPAGPSVPGSRLAVLASTPGVPAPDLDPSAR